MTCAHYELIRITKFEASQALRVLLFPSFLQIGNLNLWKDNTEILENLVNSLVRHAHKNDEAFGYFKRAILCADV